MSESVFPKRAFTQGKTRFSSAPRLCKLKFASIAATPVVADSLIALRAFIKAAIVLSSLSSPLVGDDLPLSQCTSATEGQARAEPRSLCRQRESLDACVPPVEGYVPEATVESENPEFGPANSARSLPGQTTTARFRSLGSLTASQRRGSCERPHR